MTRSILQDWVQELGLRHQGVLVASVRGCDTAPRHDPSKLLSRCLRAEILNAHVGDAFKAKTFIEQVSSAELEERMNAFLKNCDHYPHHFVMHFVHAAEVVGYHGPSAEARMRWRGFYLRACNRLHMNPETSEQLDARLNADEESFAAAQDTPPDAA